ncbi:MAG: hypothetical protein Q9190_000644 [Brigantiaea leucoxantha]
MADPVTVISVINGSAGIVLQCVKVIKDLNDVIGKYRSAHLTIRSVIENLETIQWAWDRIRNIAEDWSADSDETSGLLDKDLLERLNKSLTCGEAVMSALEADLQYLRSSDDSKSFSFTQRTRVVWSTSMLQDHQNRIRDQVASMNLLITVLNMPRQKDRRKELQKGEAVLRKSDESACSIVPSTPSHTIQDSDFMSGSSSENTITEHAPRQYHDLAHRELDIDQELFTARVYKRNYRNPIIQRLFREKNVSTKTSDPISFDPKEKPVVHVNFSYPFTEPGVSDKISTINHTRKTSMSFKDLWSFAEDASLPTRWILRSGIDVIAGPSILGSLALMMLPGQRCICGGQMHPVCYISLERFVLAGSSYTWDTLFPRESKFALDFQFTHSDRSTKAKTWINECLMEACSQGIELLMENLLCYGADVNYESKIGPCRPLHTICEKGFWGGAPLLLSFGALSMQLDSWGYNALDCSVKAFLRFYVDRELDKHAYVSNFLTLVTALLESSVGGMAEFLSALANSPDVSMLSFFCDKIIKNCANLSCEDAGGLSALLRE